MRLLALALLTGALAVGCGASSASLGSAGSGAGAGGAGSGAGGAGPGAGGASTGGAVSGPTATAASTSSSVASGGGTSSSSGFATSASSSSTSGGGGAGGGSVTTSGDCQTDADCPGGSCVPITPGGFRVCQEPPSPATGCTGALDQCCPTTQMLCPDNQPCYAGPLVPTCTGTPVPMSNQCGVDQCSKDPDCAPGQICALAGTLGLQIRACVVAYCKIDADCEAYPGGVCAPALEPCCSTYVGLYCVYPSQGGCRSNADCPPTSTQPHRFCAPSAGGVAACQTGAPDCPQ